MGASAESLSGVQSSGAGVESPAPFFSTAVPPPPLELTPSPPIIEDVRVGGNEKRGRGRPRKTPRVLNPDPPGTPPSALATPDIEKQCAVLAEYCVSTTIGICVAIFGDEWKSQPEEKQNLQNVTALYLRSKNIVDVPPGMLLLGALCAYALPRIQMEKTRAKIDGWLDKMKPKITDNL